MPAETPAPPTRRHLPRLSDYPRDVEHPSRLAAWLESRDEHAQSEAHDHTKPWYQVLWLTGVDYFSTLGYQPGIALLAAGALSPVATLVLVLATLFGALPIYSQVAQRSYAGQGSIAMLARMLNGWASKLAVLVLIGFASTDFVITMTLSAADAAQHLVENPFVRERLGEFHGNIIVTLAMLALLAAVFLKGFSEAVGVAAFLGVPYIVLNLVVVGACLREIFVYEPDHLELFRKALFAPSHPTWSAVLLASTLVFPKLALGLSGFETGVSVMPHVKGSADDVPGEPPHGRIRATRALLLAAALIMSVMLLLTSFVTTVLIPEEAYRQGGPAAGRALAYLAHKLLGEGWGTVYDISTILILWFAGASAMAGMLNLIPRNLPRFGMAPHWVEYTRPLVLVLFFIDVLVTLIFRADVEAQGGAYATGVLVLMLSAAIAVSLSLWHEGRKVLSTYFWGVSAVFAYTTVVNVIERPDGVVISSVFIISIIVLSIISRWKRATELRVEDFILADETSATMFHELVGKKVNLVPVGANTPENRARKTAFIRGHYQVEGPLAFLHVEMSDDRSSFTHEMVMRVRQVDSDFLIEIEGAVAIANTIAYVSESIDPIGIYAFLTRQSPLRQSLAFLLWGEGETAVLLYQILLQYWNWTPGDDVRPLIYIMSD